MGASVGTTLTSLISTLITLSFNGLVDVVTEAGVFWLYSALTALGVVFTLLCVPETKGKSLEEITERFKRSGDRPTDDEMAADEGYKQTAEDAGPAGWRGTGRQWSGRAANRRRRRWGGRAEGVQIQTAVQEVVMTADGGWSSGPKGSFIRHV